VLRKLVLPVLGAGVIGSAALWILTAPAVVSAGALSPYRPDPANGRTMFFAGGCAGCHATPGQDDPTKLGGGLGLKTPFGTVYVPNISADAKDGIGAWSEANFVTAVLKGTSPEGEHYFPAFPYTSFQRMKLDDVRDLFAYLKTLPAIAGKVRDHDLRFPFNIRRAAGLWKLLFLDGKPFTPDPAKSAAWNRGAYLVNGPGHCAECHSPRNFLGAIEAGQRFAGGPNLEKEGWVPNITQKGLAKWSEGDIANLLATGEMRDGDDVSGLMAEEVRNIAKLSAADRAAMAVYVKSLPPVDGPKPPPAKH
jgi:mono/diheme cytochrome c family protein